MRRGHLTVMKQTDTLVLEFLAPGSTHHTGFIEFGFKRNSRASMRTSRDFDVNSFRLFKRGFSSNVGCILRLLVQLQQFLLALFELMFQGCYEFIVLLVRRCMALEQMPLQNLFDSPIFWWFCLYNVRYKQSFNSNTSSQAKQLLTTVDGMWKVGKDTWWHGKRRRITEREAEWSEVLYCHWASCTGLLAVNISVMFGSHSNINVRITRKRSSYHTVKESTVSVC